MASRSRVRGWSRACFLLRARVFRGPVVVSSCRNVFCGRAVVFHFRQSRRRGSLSSSLRLIRSLSTFAVETLLALRGAELPSWRGVAAKRELEIIAKPLGLLHEMRRDHRATSPAAGPRRARGSAAAKRARPRKCASLARCKICDFGPDLGFEQRNRFRSLRDMRRTKKKVLRKPPAGAPVVGQTFKYIY